MFNQEIIDAFNKDFKKAKSVLILLPPDPDEQSTVAGLGLFQSLKNIGKNTQIGSSKLNQPEPIKSNIGNQNLVINFKYKEENLDKVDYDVDSQGNFQLLIKPKTGSPPPDSEKITYSYTGASADLVIVLGISSLEELGKLYSDEKKFLDQAVIASINKNSKPATFATHNFHTNSTSSIVEATAFILNKIEINPPQETANNLLREIYSSTNNLNSPMLTAETFETIAFLVKNGATPVASNLTPLVPVFNRSNDLKQTPPAQIPPDWQKPKIFRSTPPGNLNHQ